MPHWRPRCVYAAAESALALATYYIMPSGLREWPRASCLIARAALLTIGSSICRFMNRRECHWEQATHDLGSFWIWDPRNLPATSFFLQQLALTYEPQRRIANSSSLGSFCCPIVPRDPSPRSTRFPCPPFPMEGRLKPYVAL